MPTAHQELGRFVQQASRPPTGASRSAECNPVYRPPTGASRGAECKPASRPGTGASRPGTGASQGWKPASRPPTGLAQVPEGKACPPLKGLPQIAECQEGRAQADVLSLDTGGALDAGMERPGTQASRPGTQASRPGTQASRPGTQASQQMDQVHPAALVAFEQYYNKVEDHLTQKQRYYHLQQKNIAGVGVGALVEQRDAPPPPAPVDAEQAAAYQQYAAEQHHHYVQQVANNFQQMRQLQACREPSHGGKPAVLAAGDMYGAQFAGTVRVDSLKSDGVKSMFHGPYETG